MQSKFANLEPWAKSLNGLFKSPFLVYNIPLLASFAAILMGYGSGGIKETNIIRMLVGTDAFVHVFRPISLPCRIESEIFKEATFSKWHIYPRLIKCAV